MNESSHHRISLSYPISTWELLEDTLYKHQQTIDYRRMREGPTHNSLISTFVICYVHGYSLPRITYHQKAEPNKSGPDRLQPVSQLLRLIPCRLALSVSYESTSQTDEFPKYIYRSYPAIHHLPLLSPINAPSPIISFPSHNPSNHHDCFLHTHRYPTRQPCHP